MTAAASREHEIRRLAEASAWRTSLAETRLETSPAFEAWLDTDPENPRAWEQVNGPWVAVGEAAASPEWMALRQHALHRARRHGRRRWRTVRLPLLAGSIGAAAAAAVIGLWVAGAMLNGQDYRTALGERRVVTLSDGSKVSLDSNTRVHVLYSKDARKLELLSGQARFDVAHDVSRPFSVHARHETVVATGTAFNIDLLGERVRVTLLEGHVTVLADAEGAGPGPAVLRPRASLSRAGSARPAAVELAAGQGLVGEPSAGAQVVVASLERATAWESGQLIFEDEPLGAVTERVSRYTDQPIVVDPSAAGLRLSGVFNTGDVETFVDTVTHYLPVQSNLRPDGSIILVRKKL
ncbi:MAG: FecR domain-containing protein [Caulobacteraceae bacterium]|nr:FecR domain-containing protein [Caulobacteraceae bacterium]